MTRTYKLSLFLLLLSASIFGYGQPYYAHQLSVPNGYMAQAWAIFTDGAGNTFVGGDYYTPLGYRAALWNYTAGTLTDLSPTNVNTGDFVYAVGDGIQGGVAQVPIPGQLPEGHSFLFNGSVSSRVDVHPTYLGQRVGSQIEGIDPYNPNIQVGFAASSATVWNNTASSAQSINPPSSINSIAYSVSQGIIVGFATLPVGSSYQNHAIVWDTSLTPHDIHDPHYDGTFANGIDGAAIVGYGVIYNGPGAGYHALYWPDMNSAPIDLNPTSSYSFANAVRNGVIVGQADNHAVAWVGPDHHMVDLHGTVGGYSSMATGVDQFGNIVGWNSGNGLNAYLWNHVSPNQPPVAVVPYFLIVEATGPTTPVTLDGSGSFDPDAGDTLSYSWTDLWGNPIGQSAMVNVQVPFGESFFVLTVTDSHGASASATEIVDVQDTTPPAILGLSATPGSIWPPDHKMHPVTVSYQVTDADPNPSVSISVSTNGAGKDAAFQVVDLHHVLLKAEPGLDSAALVYTITITATDWAGNTSTVSVDVPVSG